MSTYVAAASANSFSNGYTVAKPSGTASGHLLLAFQAVDIGASLATPTGGTTWQSLASSSLGGGFTAAWWKIAGGSEPSTYGFTQSSADGVAAVVAVSDVSGLAPMVALSSGSGSNTVPSPSLTPLATDDLELRWAAAEGASAGGGIAVTWSPPAGYTERVDTQSRTYATGTLVTKQLSSTAATGIQNFTAVPASGTLTAFAAFSVIVSATTLAPPRIVAVRHAALQRTATW